MKSAQHDTSMIVANMNQSNKTSCTPDAQRKRACLLHFYPSVIVCDYVNNHTLKLGVYVTLSLTKFATSDENFKEDAGSP